eukprot:CAMPEP_0176244496 /NCGR_PEP_ID=MMETSP0121_2-20121125/31460_1 /TAXON_ID=160619 /ORGANISM="Kryptoperidinium foliaceum, Strain CCMP 1326" /LENGTH=351 /DNA_ID=CAMNT_0017584103 /DNA_START=82 /DNA_END=1135 /DNA_ORIENTATION=-
MATCAACWEAWWNSSSLWRPRAQGDRVASSRARVEASAATSATSVRSHEADDAKQQQPEPVPQQLQQPWREPTLPPTSGVTLLDSKPQCFDSTLCGMAREPLKVPLPSAVERRAAAAPQKHQPQNEPVSIELPHPETWLADSESLSTGVDSSAFAHELSTGGVFSEAWAQPLAAANYAAAVAASLAGNPPGLSVGLGMQQILPSLGSTMHSVGKCSPCAWYWKPRGCTNAFQCDFCHLCPEGELKSRKKAKIAARKAVAAGSAGSKGGGTPAATPAAAAADATPASTVSPLSLATPAAVGKEGDFSMQPATITFEPLADNPRVLALSSLLDRRAQPCVLTALGGGVVAEGR